MKTKKELQETTVYVASVMVERLRTVSKHCKRQ